VALQPAPSSRIVSQEHVHDRLFSVRDAGILMCGRPQHTTRRIDLLPRLIAMILFVGAFACRPAEPEGLDRDTFIDVVVALRKAARENPDSNAFDIQKAALLGEAGVTDSTLAEFIRIHNGDTRYMAAVWDSIDRKLNPPADAAAVDTVGSGS
jgi:hypothetical protein